MKHFKIASPDALDKFSILQMRFKNLEGKPKRESSKRTISANGGFGLG